MFFAHMIKDINEHYLQWYKKIFSFTISIIYFLFVLIVGFFLWRWGKYRTKEQIIDKLQEYSYPKIVTDYIKTSCYNNIVNNIYKSASKIVLLSLSTVLALAFLYTVLTNKIEGTVVADMFKFFLGAVSGFYFANKGTPENEYLGK